MLSTTYSLFLRRELPSRQTWVLTLASCLPSGIAALVRSLGGGAEFLEQTGAPLTLFGPAVLVPVFFAVAAFHEEFESRTIVYLLTRPPTRTIYVAGKLLAAWTCSALAITPGILLMGFICGSGREEIGYFVSTTGKLLVCAWAAAGVYSSLFLVFGLFLKNPVIGGLLFTFGWEYIAGILPGQLQLWTVGMYPKALFVRWADCDPRPFFPFSAPAPSGIGGVSGFGPASLTAEMEIPSLLQSAVTIPILMGAFLLLAIALFHRREDA